MIPYPLSLISYPLSLIPYPLSLISYPLSLIPYPRNEGRVASSATMMSPAADTDSFPFPFVHVCCARSYLFAVRRRMKLARDDEACGMLVQYSCNIGLLLYRRMLRTVGAQSWGYILQ